MLEIAALIVNQLLFDFFVLDFSQTFFFFSNQTKWMFTKENVLVVFLSRFLFSLKNFVKYNSLTSIGLPLLVVWCLALPCCLEKGFLAKSSIKYKWYIFPACQNANNEFVRDRKLEEEKKVRVETTINAAVHGIIKYGASSRDMQIFE